jgi:hypothetical protein
MYDPEIRKAIRIRQKTRILQIFGLKNTNTWEFPVLIWYHY